VHRFGAFRCAAGAATLVCRGRTRAAAARAQRELRRITELRRRAAERVGGIVLVAGEADCAGHWDTAAIAGQDTEAPMVRP
jgi:hypothetical protein